MSESRYSLPPISSHLKLKAKTIHTNNQYAYLCYVVLSQQLGEA